MAWQLLAAILGPALASAQIPTVEGAGTDRSDVRFSQMATNSSKSEVQRRLGYEGPEPAYKLADETFRVIVPGSYSTNFSWGLLVWVSPANEVWLPAGWKQELERRRLLFVGANNGGNERNLVARGRLALDGADNMIRQFKIDRKRVYIGGLSGGARMASILGVAYADTFSGTFCVCGVDFYQYVPVGNGLFYPVDYTPGARNLGIAKKSGRFVLLTGENDINRDNTKAVMEKGFKINGFRNVLYLEEPGMGHTMPNMDYLRMALDFMTGTNKPPAVSAPGN